MNPSLAPRSPAPAAPGWLVRQWRDPDTRSTLIGLLGVLLIHLLLWGVSPHLLTVEPLSPRDRPVSPARDFSIELAPETFAKPPDKPLPPNKFVETNPDAPANIPDQTQNFSDRNTQVAQEKPTPDGKSDRPATEGKKDFESTQIVSGRLTNPLEHVEAVPPTPETTAPERPNAMVKAEQNPLPGFEKREGESKDSFGTNVAKFPDNVRPIPQRVEGQKGVPLVEGAFADQPAIDPKRPRPRPQMVKTQNVRPAILAQHEFGTKNIGPVAYDAKWSAYGEYLRRMIDSVQIQWERILVQGTVNPPSGTFVVVKFTLNSEGRISAIGKVDNHSTEQGASAAVSAITDRAPYGPWTDDMRAVLGEQQELTFSFYYQ